MRSSTIFDSNVGFRIERIANIKIYVIAKSAYARMVTKEIVKPWHIRRHFEECIL